MHTLYSNNLEIALCNDQTNFDLAICSMQLEEGVPEWVHLMPLGNIQAADGRQWTNNSPEDVIALSKTIIDHVVDYEHQTDHAATNGQPAPAAGWIKQMELRPNGIWGRVEWTAKAKAHLENREYRYISPTFKHNKDGQVRKIERAALVNSPAIHELTALAKSQNQENTMEELLKALAKAMGLPETADEKTVLAKLAEINAASVNSATLVSAMCTALSVEEKDVTTEALQTALAKKLETSNGDGKDEIDPSQYVSMAHFQKTADELKTLQIGLLDKDATAAVDAAIAGGHIAPVQRDWAMAYAKKDPGGFTAFAKAQPVIFKPGGEILTKVSGDSTTLSDDEIATCKTLNISEEAFLATKNKE